MLLEHFCSFTVTISYLLDPAVYHLYSTSYAFGPVFFAIYFLDVKILGTIFCMLQFTSVNQMDPIKEVTEVISRNYVQRLMTDLGTSKERVRDENFGSKGKQLC